jgi:hypothetical protein
VQKEKEMAKYTVNYSCGHSEVIQLYGKCSEREKRISWLEQRICPQCFKKEKEEEKRIANEQAAKEAKEKGLPNLIGSIKQIAWAETIRKNALSSSSNQVLENYIPKDEKEKVLYEKAKELRKYLETEISSKWWIDNRNTVDCYIRNSLNNIIY